MDDNRAARQIASLVRAETAPEQALEERFAAAMSSQSALDALHRERIAAILAFWSERRCENAIALHKMWSAGTPLQDALSRVDPYDRLATRPRPLLHDTSRGIRTVRTSGSSGFPLPYSLSAEWRTAHHCVWRLAYRHMTNGQLQGYLDPATFWAMARVPEGSSDCFPHQIECCPTPAGLTFSCPPQTVRPGVVHGSITTVLEMLEDPSVQRWRPTLIVFTYESVHDWQLHRVRQFWDAPIHIEYAANDGAAAAFTCSAYRLHYWSQRSIPLMRDGSLRVIDLWNTATAFIGYECGDDMTWEPSPCPCGSVLPTMTVHGRVSGTIQLTNGARISSFCPFDAEELRGVSAIRVEVEAEDVACVRFVRAPSVEPAFEAIASRLLATGFVNIRFEEVDRIVLLRDPSRKFRAVVDSRAQQPT